MHENDISRIVVECAFQVHKELGPGLLESVYEHCLAYELKKERLKVEIQKPIPVYYKSERLDCGFRSDIIVEDKLIVELKAVEALNDVHMAQILTYLKLSDMKIGLLINFNVKLIKHGIKRVINGYIN